ncbi:MAG: hypothetical protein AAGA92_02660 [Planctomycetota bacterium]
MSRSKHTYNAVAPGWLRLLAVGTAVAILSACQPADGAECGCGPDCGVIGPGDEYLCDGGDAGLPVGVRADWTIDGLEQEDTIAHYDTVDGRVLVTPSNRVCIYAPRFAVVRRVVDPGEYANIAQPRGYTEPVELAHIDETEEAAGSLALLEPTIHRAEDLPNLAKLRQQPGELDRDLALIEAIGIDSPHAHLQIVRAGEISLEERAVIGRLSLAAVSWSGDQAVQITIDNDQAVALVSEATPGTIYHLEEPNSPKLRLVKLASCGSALPGEEIEFTLRFDNIGDRAMGNVTIVDNLTTRLAYVEGSQKSSVPAEFKTRTNGRGSLVLRWEIRDPVEPGEGGVLRFTCRVL